MNRNSVLTALALIGAGIVIGVLLISNLGDNAITRALAANADIGATAPPVTVSDNARALNGAFTAVAAEATKSVVSVSVKTEVKIPTQRFFEFDPRDFFRFEEPKEREEEPPSREGESTGSGVIISANGYVVTNNHVIENATEKGITVITHDKKEYRATLVGKDPFTDLAVLKIEGGSFVPAHFADKRSISVGEWVVAVGNPLGLRSTVTSGIISAIGRGIGIIGSDMRRGKAPYAIENFIQTDAAINPGNSGGGLFNLSGSLVGINTAIASRTGMNVGYGFAIPVDIVKSVALDLIEDGKIDRGFVGVQISSIDETAAKTVGLPKVTGVMVNSVVPNGAAESAGIEVGDVILEVDNQPVRTSNELQNEIVLRRPGDKVTLKLWRNKKEILKTITLKALDSSDNFAEDSAPKRGAEQRGSDHPVTFETLGFTAVPLNEQTKKDVNVDSGVLVTKVNPRGPVARRGLRNGVVILKADGKNITSTSDLKNVISSKKSGDGLLLIIKTQDGRSAITVEIPEEKS